MARLSKRTIFRGLLGAAGALILLTASLSPVSAAPRGAGSTRLFTTVFRLHVAGQADPRTTYWVAYGPLAGTWGIVRLHAAGHGLEIGSRALPAKGTTTFDYVAGQGVVHTKLGPAPGNPVYTIAQIGPTSPMAITRHTVEWQAPVG
jgi:hypothetical protein